MRSAPNFLLLCLSVSDFTGLACSLVSGVLRELQPEDCMSRAFVTAYIVSEFMTGIFTMAMNTWLTATISIVR